MKLRPFGQTTHQELGSPVSMSKFSSGRRRVWGGTTPTPTLRISLISLLPPLLLVSRGFSQRRRRSRKNLVVATANTTTYTKIPFVEADLLLVQEIKSVAAGIESMKNM